jgi:hypothetical protein
MPIAQFQRRLDGFDARLLPKRHRAKPDGRNACPVGLDRDHHIDLPSFLSADPG